MRTACARISKPMMANMADGGKTPIRSKTALAEIGYKMAIFPSATGLAAAAAAENALRVLKTEGTSDSPNSKLFNFSEFNSLIGFEEVWEFERRWARPKHDGRANERNSPASAPAPSGAPGPSSSPAPAMRSRSTTPRMAKSPPAPSPARGARLNCCSKMACSTNRSRRSSPACAPPQPSPRR